MESEYLDTKLREAGLSDEQIEKVKRILDNICTECWEQDKPCYCWRDE